jgi:CubicO group peptidase (beta-lactamase class C family)
LGRDQEPGSWKQKGLTIIGSALFLALAAGVGLYTFLMASVTPLHPNPADVPAVRRTAPLPKWTGAVEQGQRLARAGLVEQNLPGLSVAVGVDGEIVWAEGLGWADIEKRVPVSPEMRFRIGHVSKALTSAGVGLLLEQGELDLDEDIRTYVPGFPAKAWTITLRQLMGHVAGVRHYQSEGDYMPSAHCERASEGLGPFADDPLRFQPETRYSYSTFGWVLVSAAVEAAAHEPFATFMRTRILLPLGMRDTTTDSSSDPVPDTATFYYPRMSGDPQYGPEIATDVDYSCFTGAGAFLSTPSDLVRFGMAFSSGNLLKPETVRTLQSPQLLLSGDETEFGLGWTLETVPLAGERSRLASHASRTLLGGSAWLLTFPERGIVVAVMSNISYAALRPVALEIAQAFAEQRKNPASR